MSDILYHLIGYTEPDICSAKSSRNRRLMPPLFSAGEECFFRISDSAGEFYLPRVIKPELRQLYSYYGKLKACYRKKECIPMGLLASGNPAASRFQSVVGRMFRGGALVILSRTVKLAGNH